MQACGFEVIDYLCFLDGRKVPKSFCLNNDLIEITPGYPLRFRMGSPESIRDACDSELKAKLLSRRVAEDPDYCLPRLLPASATCVVPPAPAMRRGLGVGVGVSGYRGNSAISKPFHT